MAKFIFANNATTTLASAINSTTTTIAVATGTGVLFPQPTAGQQFALTLTQASDPTASIVEIVYVTAVVGDTFTVIRGQESTTARSWVVGDHAANFLTAGTEAALAQQSDVQTQAGNYGVDTGGANACAVTLSPAPVSQASLVGVPIRFKKGANPNTGSVTLNVNGFGNVALNLPGGTALASGAIAAGAIVECFYDGSQYQMLSIPSVLSPAGPAGGDLTGTYPNPTVGANKIGNSKLAQMAATSIKANTAGSAANASDVSISTFLTFLGFGTASIASPGYITLPGGLILQWGVSSFGASSTFTTKAVTFPTAFPTACFGVLATGNSKALGDSPSTGGDWDIVGTFSASTSGFTIRIDTNQNITLSGTHNVTWFALGN